MRKIWTENDINILKENYKLMEIKDLAKLLGRSRSSVGTKLNRLGLSRVLWSNEELEYLINNYPTVKGIDIAKKLKRSENSIYHKANRLGLVRRGENREPRYYLLDGYLACSEFNDRYFVHRRVMEEFLGRPLTSDEIVHHIDGDKLNNSLDNLELHTRESHMLEHNETRERDEFGRYL